MNSLCSPRVRKVETMQRAIWLWLAVGALVGGWLHSQIDTTASAQLRNPPTPWDYDVVEAAQNLEYVLSDRGNRGWELVAIAPRDQGGPGNTLFVFKRPKR